MSWSTIWKAFKNKDLRKRILAVLGMIVVFRVLAHIPIPLAEPTQLKQIIENVLGANKSPQLLNFIDILSGGALSNLAIMLIGLSPYINASIIMQLMTRAIPKLENMNKEGEYGRKRVNQYTRILTFPLAIIQSIGTIYLVRQTALSLGGFDITAKASILQWILMIAALTGGAMLLMWLGELITEQGVGNGISLVITVGIVSRLPSTVSQFAQSIFSTDKHVKILGMWLPINTKNLLISLGVLAATLAVIVVVIKLNEASRKLTVNYAKRVQGNRVYGGVTTTLPVKLITAGVVPMIFAQAFLSVPQFAGRLLQNAGSARLQHIGTFMNDWFIAPTAETLRKGGWHPYFYPLVYFALVFMFTYFYTSIAFNAKEIAENLQKQGGFIADVRAGNQTEKYLGRVVNKLTLFGAISLGLLALMPIVAQYFFTIQFASFGTGILILVAVALETLRQLESRALLVMYDSYADPTAPVNIKKRRRLFTRSSAA